MGFRKKENITLTWTADVVETTLIGVETERKTRGCRLSEGFTLFVVTVFIKRLSGDTTEGVSLERWSQDFDNMSSEKNTLVSSAVTADNEP